MARVQMTPDLLPADILGVTIWDQRRGEFEFKAGPIFHNVILADEINRTTPRTQSALLEAMNEGQVSIDGVTRRLVQPFIVIATQNPFEFEGTYFLPESQLDRFLMRIHLGYPRPEEEARVLTLQPSSHIQEVRPVMTGRDLLELQSKVPQVRIDDSLVQYIIRLATATRQHDKVQVGVSTRGTLALAQAARATALMKKRDYVTPDDIQTNVVPVCAHRILARSAGYDGADGRANAAILKQILESVSTPL
jgi:MoxR-like ATPase